MSSAIVDGTNIDVSVFSFSDPKPNPAGGKVVNMYNKEFKQYFTMSTPLMMTWGPQEGTNDKKEPNGKWSMSLQFPSGEYATPETDAFLQSMKAVESAVRKVAITNSVKWFGKDIKSEEVIEEKFNPMLRYPKKEAGSAEFDYTRSPTLTVKIPKWNGVWKPEIYDEDGEPMYINGKVNAHLSPLEFIKKQSHMICLLQCAGLWFANGKCSITWNLIQAIVQKPRPSIVTEGTCFLKPKAADKEKMKTLPPPEDIDPEGVPTTLVEDSDNEDELESYKQQQQQQKQEQKQSGPVPTPTPEPIVAQEEPVQPMVVEEEPVVAVTAAVAETKKKTVVKKVKKNE